MSGQYHIPVLLHELIDGLNIRKEGIYVDCTFGGGGHSEAILKVLGPTGKLIAFDQDEDAKKNLSDDPRVIFIQQNFRHLQRFLRFHNINDVNGIIADLGVSSHQLDKPERGFSTRYEDAIMDMRMDRRQALTANDIMQTYTEKQLHRIFEEYGEISNSKTLARTLVKLRRHVSLKTIKSFKNALREMVKGNPKKYFAQVFQALRIEVNDEIVALREMLQQVPSLLKPGGRIAIISFHSLEDRMVKNFFRYGRFEESEENPFETREIKSPLKLITKKPIIPSPKEIKENPRASSAKLRIAEKV